MDKITKFFIISVLVLATVFTISMTLMAFPGYRTLAAVLLIVVCVGTILVTDRYEMLEGKDSGDKDPNQFS